MYKIGYSLVWKYETIRLAITLYFQWMCLVSIFHSDNAWSGSKYNRLQRHRASQSEVSKDRRVSGSKYTQMSVARSSV